MHGGSGNNTRHIEGPEGNKQCPVAATPDVLVDLDAQEGPTSVRTSGKTVPVPATPDTMTELVEID